MEGNELPPRLLRSNASVMTESSPLDTDFVGPGEFGHIVDPDAFDADVREAAAGLPHVWPPTARPTKVMRGYSLWIHHACSQTGFFRNTLFTQSFSIPSLERLYALNISRMARRTHFLLQLSMAILTLSVYRVYRWMANAQNLDGLLPPFVGNYFLSVVAVGFILLPAPALTIHRKLTHFTEAVCYTAYTVLLVLWGVMYHIVRGVMHTFPGEKTQLLVLDWLSWTVLLGICLGYMILMGPCFPLRSSATFYLNIAHVVAFVVGSIVTVSRHPQPFVLVDGLFRTITYVALAAVCFWLSCRAEFELRGLFLTWLSNHLEAPETQDVDRQQSPFMTVAERLYDGVNECMDLLQDMQSGVKLNSAQGRRYFAKLRQLLEDCMSQLRSGENLYGLCYGKHEMGEEQIEIMDAYLVSSKHRLSTQNMTLQFQMTATGSMVGRPALVSAATTERMASVDMSNIDAVDYNTLTSDWNFDVLGYFEQAPRGFVSIGCSLLGRYLSLCDVDKATVVRFLGKLESMYRDVPYHNKIHGAMVAQKWMCLAKYTNLLDHLSVQDEALCVVAAIAHDVGHPGRNNAFFVRAHHPVAHLYNDNAVLENYHAACTLRILRMPGCNIFADIDYDYVRSLLIELILATDTVNNFEMNSQFVLSCSRADFSLQDLKARMLTGKMLIKAADVSAPTMPWAISLAWVGRLLGEFYAQGAEEAQMGLPVSALCDRAHHDQAAKSQAAFLKIVVSPLYKSIASLGSPAMDEIMRQAEENTERWQEMDKSGETIPCVDCEESEANLDVSWVLEPAAPQR